MAGSAVFTLYYIGNKIVDETLDESFFNTPNLSASSSAPSVTPTPIPNFSRGNNSSPANNISQITTPTSATNIPSSKNSSAPAVSQIISAPIITKKDIQEIKNNITASDKIFIASKVVSKISPEEMTQFKAMASDGLTTNEKSNIRSIVYSRFNSEDISRLKEIYYRYK